MSAVADALIKLSLPNNATPACSSAWTVYAISVREYGVPSPVNVSYTNTTSDDPLSVDTATAASVLLLLCGLVAAFIGARVGRLVTILAAFATGLGVGLTLVYSFSNWGFTCARAWGASLGAAGAAALIISCLVLCTPSLMGSLIGIVATTLFFAEFPQVDSADVFLKKGIVFWVTLPIASLVVGWLLFRRTGRVFMAILTAMVGAFSVQKGADFAVAAARPKGDYMLNQASGIAIFVSALTIGLYIQLMRRHLRLPGFGRETGRTH